MRNNTHTLKVKLTAKRNATIEGTLYRWIDTGLHSVTINCVCADGVNKEVNFSGLNINANKAFNIAAKKLTKWSHGRYYFTNLSIRALKYESVRNDKLAWNQQQMHSFRHSDHDKHCAKRKYRNGGTFIAGGKKYLAVEKMQGNDIHNANCGGPKDNMFWLAPNPVHRHDGYVRPFDGDYQAMDAWKWDANNQHILEKIM